MSLPSWEKKKERVVKDSDDLKTRILLAVIKTKRKLHIRYSKPSGIDERWITPTKVFYKNGENEAYLEATCHKRNARRVFMIKRITIISANKIKTETEGNTLKIDSGSVACSVNFVDLEGDFDNYIEGVEVTCSRCGHSTVSYGVSDSSIKRCLALMGKDCPRAESNWYEQE